MVSQIGSKLLFYWTCHNWPGSDVNENFLSHFPAGIELLSLLIIIINMIIIVVVVDVVIISSLIQLILLLTIISSILFSHRTCEAYSSSLWFLVLARWRLCCLRLFGCQCCSFGCWFPRLPVMCANCEIHRTEMVSHFNAANSLYFEKVLIKINLHDISGQTN